MSDKIDNKDINRGNELVTTLLSNRILKIDRKEFLYQLFKEEPEIEKILENGPIEIIDEKQIASIAKKAINNTTMKSSAASFASGLPGGVAVVASIPADILQFYGMSINLAQKLMYLYGYPDMYNDDKLTQEGKNSLIIFLGVMLGVSGAGTAVKGISSALAGQAVKKLPQQALTKTVYYPIIKKTLANFGVKVTKNSFAKSVSKVIPVVGGVVSGGLTLATLRPMGYKLQKALHEGTYAPIVQDDIIKDVTFTQVTNSEEDEAFEKLKKTKELFDLGIVSEDEYTEIREKYLKDFL